MLATTFYFILTLFVLVLVHEFGHFLVARWCGVRVLRFSFGFGRNLGKWRDKRGTEFIWSLWPLGGYVKFLDENEAPVAPSERRYAFNHQPRWARVSIVLAGPLFNFLFAFVLLWLVAVIGIKSFAPRIETIQPNSVAALGHVGKMQEIIALDGKPIHHWRDMHYAMLSLLGTHRTVAMTVKDLKTSHISVHFLPLAQWQFDSKRMDLLESLGIVPLFPKLPLIVGIVGAHSPAQKAHVIIGDKIIAVDQQPMADWQSLADYVHQRPNTKIAIQLERQGQLHTLNVYLETNAQDQSGFLGVGPQPLEIPADWLRMERSGPIEAIGQAAYQTATFIWTTLSLIGRTVVGSFPLEQLSGPVGIAKAASESAQIGHVYYLLFVALLSISIGVLNLLPIPLLDGGHLLFEFIEAILGRTIPKKWKIWGVYLGVCVIILLTMIALYNDLA